jgi:hypothetical protein
LAAAVVVGCAALILPRLARDHRLQEVDRFHRAGQITSDWAQAGVTKPVLVDDAAPDDKDDEAVAEPGQRHDRRGASAQH